QERVEVAALLEKHRLVTLTGIGGAGKTRLALRVAEDTRPSFPDGVWLVEAAPLTSEALLYQAIAAVLDLREEQDRSPAASLLDFLGEKRLLLVLDNCEHMVEASATAAAAIVHACPLVHILVTSREALGIVGERVFQLPPLSLPEPTEAPTLSAVSRSEAMQLLLDRMPPAGRGAAHTERDAAAAVEICRRLDGIPLAIELAAARLGALSLEALAARLDDRFGLLTAGNRGAPSRQRTLRAAMDWSYDLLTGAEQAVLRRAAVFQGIWCLDAAEPVCAGAEVPSTRVAPILASLVAKSLVRVVESVDSRAYTLLETVRHYGLEKLRECDELAETRGRHRLFYVTLAEQATRERASPLLPTWVRRLEAERDNLRAAIKLPVECVADHALRARLVIGLRFFWDIRGYLGEGRQYLTMVLAAQQKLEPVIQAWALTVAGDLAYRQGDCVAARAQQLAGRRLFQTLGDAAGIAASTIGLGNVAQYEGRHEQAAAL
ncbi:MAG: ATP-binding protein, partial [Chloroflexota bacterium]